MSKVRVLVLYPKGEGSTFDMEYYKNKHRPLVERCIGPVEFTITEGIEGQPYLAVGELTYESMEAMQKAMASPGAGETQTDVANYTNVTPQLQISTLVE